MLHSEENAAFNQFTTLMRQQLRVTSIIYKKKSSFWILFSYFWPSFLCGEDILFINIILIYGNEPVLKLFYREISSIAIRYRHFTDWNQIKSLLVTYTNINTGRIVKQLFQPITTTDNYNSRCRGQWWSARAFSIFCLYILFIK